MGGGDRIEEVGVGKNGLQRTVKISVYRYMYRYRYRDIGVEFGILSG